MKQRAPLNEKSDGDRRGCLAPSCRAPPGVRHAAFLRVWQPRRARHQSAGLQTPT